MSLKKQPTTVLSFSSQHRLATFFQILTTIDKRMRSTKTKQTKAPNQGRKISSLTERAFIAFLTLGILLALIVTIRWSPLTNTRSSYLNALRYI